MYKGVNRPGVNHKRGETSGIRHSHVSLEKKQFFLENIIFEIFTEKDSFKLVTDIFVILQFIFSQKKRQQKNGSIYEDYE